MNSKTKIAIFGFVFLVILTISYAEIYVNSGHIKVTTIYGEMDTQRWGGIVASFSGYQDETNSPVGTYTFGSSAEIASMVFPGSNFIDGKHYLLAMHENLEFNLTKVRNITPADLEAFGLFNSDSYPIFHPNYDDWSDNPKKTFYLYGADVVIAGIHYTAYYTITRQNVPEYLLKYQVNDTYAIPMFIVKISDNYTCYDSSSCEAQLILPLEKTYYFYIVSKEVPVKLDVWIDGAQVLSFSQTALPYNLTIRATHLYTGEPLNGTDVIVFEENGHNIFVPKMFSGMIGRGISHALTNENGFAEFIVVPTKYTDVPEDYSIGVGVYTDDIYVSRRKNLTVSSWTSLEKLKKPVSPTNLGDNVKTTVNSMIQIISTLYKWANQQEKAWKYRITIYTNGTYKVMNLTDYLYYDTAIFKTGAPNLVYLDIRNPDGTTANAYGMFEERKGYLILSPTTNPPVVSDNEHVKRLFKIHSGDQVVVTPTKYGLVNSTVTLYIFDESSDNLLTSVSFPVDNSLDIYGGSYYSDDNLKTIVNAMVQVISTVYYAIN